ncbi:hypothetical protein GIS00_18105 [Nakamurella sp. YIM 132087]|uniref:Cellulose biosynthesis cyclic di-GMP-binding regulatory protein BcsB n=1 Tax=Nakamurella alba TaxID=2665158 RepID=A0A7K1FNV9_9ACTN|nr:hypothetical protein [Nakamurella alba]MTD15852.1 hypothetical protein [Nakamurella alba]
MHRSSRLALALLLTAAAALTPLGTAAAAAPTGETTAESTVGAARSYPTSLSANLGGGTTSLAVPVAAGLTPTRLTATVTPGYDTALQTVVSVGDRIVATVAGTAPKAIDVPLVAGDLGTDGLLLSLAVTPQTGVAVCADPNSFATLDGIAVDTTGTATAPTTVAGFFDDSVDRITVVVPEGTAPDGADGLGAAALQAVAALSHRYGRIGTNTAVVDLAVGGADVAGGNGTVIETGTRIAPGGETATDAPAVASNPRVVALTAGTGDVTTVVGETSGVPTMTFTGPAAGLLAAVRALDTDALVLADGDSTIGLAGDTMTASQAVASLDDLTGQSVITLSGYGRHTSYVGVRQAAFGGPVSSAKVHLEATTTALADSTQARLSVYWNDYLLSSSMIGAGEPIRLDLEVPADRMQRDNGLVLQLDALPSAAGCTDNGLPVQITVDGAGSFVEASGGQTLPAGFGRFPQALAGSLPVAFGSTDATSLPLAGHYVSALQGGSPVSLQVAVVPADALISGDRSSASGLLIGATPEQVNAAGAPLRVGQFRQLGGTAPLTVGSNTPVATVQAFQSGSRDLVMTAAWAPSGTPTDNLSTALADRVDGVTGAEAVDGDAAGQSRPNGWADLGSDLLIATAAGIDSIDSNALAPQAQILVEHSGIPWWVWVLVGGVLLVAFARWRITVRRRAAVARYLDEEQRRIAETAAAAAEAEAVLVPRAPADETPTGPIPTNPGPARHARSESDGAGG